VARASEKIDVEEKGKLLNDLDIAEGKIKR
jgi:hypothetical protein